MIFVEMTLYGGLGGASSKILPNSFGSKNRMIDRSRSDWTDSKILLISGHFLY